MALSSIPAELRNRFHIEERGHASAILERDYPSEFEDILACLTKFRISKSEILAGGGGRSTISARLDNCLRQRNWAEKSFDTRIVVDGKATPTPTHKIDNFKNEIGLEVEWNNKTEFYDRDLNNFRLLKELRVLAVGVIVTRMSELQLVFNVLGPKIGAKYGASTTHWRKLIPKVDGGGAGGCPLLLIGIT
ncbi:MAG: BglII/BstYI family type II restriction endonuclease, partial [Terriglobales bacterium]